MILGVRMPEKHVESSLTYLDPPIARTVTEDLNANIELVKCDAGDFRSFGNNRIQTPVVSGKLNLYPLWSRRDPSRMNFRVAHHHAYSALRAIWSGINAGPPPLARRKPTKRRASELTADDFG